MPHASSAGGKPRRCEGPPFLAGLRKLVELFQDLDDPVYLADKCCDHCRGPTSRAVRYFEDGMSPIVDTLSSIHTHAFDGEKAIPSVSHRLSPFKLQPHGSALFVSDDSDD